MLATYMKVKLDCMELSVAPLIAVHGVEVCELHSSDGGRLQRQSRRRACERLPGYVTCDIWWESVSLLIPTHGYIMKLVVHCRIAVVGSNALLKLIWFSPAKEDAY